MTVKVNPNVLKRIEAAARIGVLAGANIVRNKAIELITTTPKTGVTYRRNSVVRQRSAPGEPYANDTGNTMNQIQQPELHETLPRATVVFGGLTARRLELGTELMAPRPVAVPALNSSREEIEKVIGEEIAAALKKGSL